MTNDNGHGDHLIRSDEELLGNPILVAAIGAAVGAATDAAISTLSKTPKKIEETRSRGRRHRKRLDPAAYALESCEIL